MPCGDAAVARVERDSWYKVGSKAAGPGRITVNKLATCCRRTQLAAKQVRMTDWWASETVSCNKTDECRLH